jgi:DUF4097 and DUF4098 domain-containing protein YvlB
MIRRLIELVVLAILVVGLIYILNAMGPIGADVKAVFKYIGLGILIIFGGGILLAIITIIFGVSWLKSITSAKNFSKGSYNIGDIVKDSVSGAIKGSFGSTGDMMGSSSREIEISMDNYDWPSLKIKNSAGDIKLSGLEGKAVKGKIEVFEREIGDAEIIFEEGEIKLKTKSGKKAALGDIALSLSKDISALEIESASGDISIDGFSIKSDSSFKGISGDIKLSEFKNDEEVLIKTISGDIIVRDSKFNSILGQSVSGDIKINGSSAENAILKTVSGDIDYRKSLIKNPVVKTVSGDVLK